MNQNPSSSPSPIQKILRQKAVLEVAEEFAPDLYGKTRMMMMYWLRWRYSHPSVISYVKSLVEYFDPETEWEDITERFVSITDEELEEDPHMKEVYVEVHEILLSLAKEAWEWIKKEG